MHATMSVAEDSSQGRRYGKCRGEKTNQRRNKEKKKASKGLGVRDEERDGVEGLKLLCFACRRRGGGAT